MGDISEGVSNVMGDEGQLHQLFMNLGLNACEARPKGGTIEVTAGAAVADEDFFRLPVFALRATPGGREYIAAISLKWLATPIPVQRRRYAVR